MMESQGHMKLGWKRGPDRCCYGGARSRITRLMDDLACQRDAMVSACASQTVSSARVDLLGSSVSVCAVVCAPM